MLRNIINIVVLLGLALFIGLFIFDWIWNRRHRAKGEALLSGYKSLKTNWLQTPLSFISEGAFANS